MLVHPMLLSSWYLKLLSTSLTKMVLQVSSKHRYNMSLLKQWFKVSAHTGIQADIGFQMSGYAVSESQGSLTLTVVVEGNVSRPFNVSITAVDGTASCESFIWLQINNVIYIVYHEFSLHNLYLYYLEFIHVLITWHMQQEVIMSCFKLFSLSALEYHSTQST